MTDILKPLFLDSDGIFARLPDGSVINIGGVQGPIFTVDGKGLWFDDGSSTGGNGTPVSLQTVYNRSASPAKIKLTTGKDFIIADDTDDGVFFKVDSRTGKVTITGDLEVAGLSTVINTTIQDSDHWIISPSAGSTTALKIEPDIGVTPIADLINVRVLNGQPAVFRIDKDGNTVISKNLTVAGTINGVDVAALKQEVDEHVNGTGNKHHAASILIDAIVGLNGAANVQEALESLLSQIGQSGQIGNGDVSGYEHIQSTAATMWMISHGKNTKRTQVVLYDNDYQQIIPDVVKVMDQNTVAVMFASPVAGRAMLTLF